ALPTECLRYGAKRALRAAGRLIQCGAEGTEELTAVCGVPGWGNKLVLMKKGRTRSEGDDCPICQLPIPLDFKRSEMRLCCMKKVCKGCVLAARKRGMRDCPFCRTSTPKTHNQVLAPSPCHDKKAGGR
ncbi:hypothetical protein THAOC_14060, partial [Thalassiosira oceanica]